MAYTPELSLKHSSTLRRIAWALNRPMTKAIEEVFDYLATVIDSRTVCAACRDKSRCRQCAFWRDNRKLNGQPLFKENAMGGVK